MESVTPPTKARLKPVSPVLNEAGVLEALRAPAAIQTNEYTRNASVLAVMSVIDRKLDRDYIYGTLVEAVNLNEFLRRAEMLSRVIYDLQKGELTLDKCQQVLAGLLQQAERRRRSLESLIAKVEQMPVESDPIH